MATDKTPDAVLEALDMLDDWVMDRILKDKGEKPPDEQQEPQPDADAEIDLQVEPDADELGGAPDGDEDDGGDEPKVSVLRRYDFAGAKPPSPKQEAPSLEEEMRRKVPVQKRR